MEGTISPSQYIVSSTFKGKKILPIEVSRMAMSSKVQTLEMIHRSK
jgi:hypothetical protein